MVGSRVGFVVLQGRCLGREWIESGGVSLILKRVYSSVDKRAFLCIFKSETLKVAQFLFIWPLKPSGSVSPPPSYTIIPQAEAVFLVDAQVQVKRKPENTVDWMLSLVCFGSWLSLETYFSTGTLPRIFFFCSLRKSDAQKFVIAFFIATLGSGKERSILRASSSMDSKGACILSCCSRVHPVSAMTLGYT